MTLVPRIVSPDLSLTITDDLALLLFGLIVAVAWIADQVNARRHH